MESKEKVELLKEAINQLLKEEKESTNNDDLLSKLLSQLESLEEHPLVGEGDEKSSDSSSGGIEKDEIVKELGRVRRQNLITHCLMTAMLLVTVAWQLSEVSLILKVKDGLSHPFRSLTAGVMKLGQGMNAGENGNSKQKIDARASSIPGLRVPELPHVEFPALDFHIDQQE